METWKRSITKTASWKVISALTTFLIAYFIFKQNFGISVGLGLIEITIKVIMYLAHERIWVSYVRWGYIGNGKERGDSKDRGETKTILERS